MIRTSLQIARKKTVKAAKACYLECGQALCGTVRMVRRARTIEMRGVRIPVDGEFSSKVLADLYFGDYEAAEMRIVSKKISKEDVVLEFGGGLGLVSTYCAQLIGSERVFCYEANPAMIKVIKRTYGANRVLPNLTHGLLGTEDGVAELFVGDHFYGASTVSRVAGAKSVKVPSFSINPVIRNLGPTFLIMDVEGGERDLIPVIDFSGIRKMIVELHPGRIGEDGINLVRRRITEAGFSVDVAVSEEKILFVEKLG